jgi:hypothetical protein
MNDRIPGSCWSNSIWFGKWRIYISGSECSYNYSFTHDDYDGAEDALDDRHGCANTIEECKAEIADRETK